MTALLNEFASSTRATDVGLTWEAHLKAKKRFEVSSTKYFIINFYKQRMKIKFVIYGTLKFFETIFFLFVIAVEKFMKK